MIVFLNSRLQLVTVATGFIMIKYYINTVQENTYTRKVAHDIKPFIRSVKNALSTRLL